nr:reverse transcriptase domain-containing protein [Tanacetum cinerariifolium]
MEPKRTTKSSPATMTPTATSVTDTQRKALIDQGVARALAVRNADRSRNGEDNHDSGMGVRRQTPPAWYNQHFQELALLCVRMFPEESGTIERYISGLPDMINRSVVASKPKTMQEAIEMTTELMDKKSALLLNVRQRTKGSKMITTTKLSNNLSRSKMRNQDHGNQAGGTGAHGMVQALEGGETNQYLNDVEDDINA